jgi:hypothetical protein
VTSVRFELGSGGWRYRLCNGPRFDEARAAGARKIMTKLEKPSAVERWTPRGKSDAVSGAGDLGVELPAEKVPAIQRRIVRACRRGASRLSSPRDARIR